MRTVLGTRSSVLPAELSGTLNHIADCYSVCQTFEAVLYNTAWADSLRITKAKENLNVSLVTAYNNMTMTKIKSKKLNRCDFIVFA